MSQGEEHDTGATHSTVQYQTDGLRHRPHRKIVPKKRWLLSDWKNQPNDATKTRRVKSRGPHHSGAGEGRGGGGIQVGCLSCVCSPLEPRRAGRVKAGGPILLHVICTLTQLEPQSTLETLTQHRDDTNTNHPTTLCFSSLFFSRTRRHVLMMTASTKSTVESISCP